MTTSAVQPDPNMSAILQPSGVVHMRWAAGTTITEDLARRSIELVTAVSVGRRRPLLVDMSHVKAMTREARGIYGGNDDMTALALVGQSPVVRVIANFALNLNRPGVPTRFCSTAAEAESWLGGYVA